MSFSLPLIAVPPPAVSGAGGAAAPDASGQAASTFSALLSALLGDTPEAQGQAPVAPGTKGKALASNDTPQGEITAPDDDAETLAAEASLLAAAAQAPAPPVPIVAPAEASGPVIAPALDGAASPEPQQPLVPADIETDLAAATNAPPVETPGAAAPATETAPKGAVAMETTAEPAPRTAQATDAKPPVSSPAVEQAAQNADRRPAPAPAAAPVVAEAAPAAPPPAAPAAAQASVAAAAQPLMTAAVAASATSVKATQTSEPDEGATAEGDAPTPPTAAKAGDAKPNAVVEQAKPDAFNLLQPNPRAVAPKAEGPTLVAGALEPAVGDAAPIDIEPLGASTHLDAPDQSSASTAAQASAAHLDAREAARVAATSATVADLAAQVSRKLQGRNTHFDIQLTPEGLGRVDVRVDIDAQGKLTAAMAFDNPHAAAELRGRAGDLQRALEQAGFDISGGLSFQSPQDGRGGGQFADQAPDREAWQGRAFQNALGVADEAETAAVAARLYQQRRSPTGVDLRI